MSAFAATLALLLLPAFAAALTYEVNDVGDGGGGQAACQAQTAGCTLRGAVQAANLSSGRDEVSFKASLFNGEAGDTIVLGSALPPITGPLAIDAGPPCTTAPGPNGPCAGVTGVAGQPVIDFEAAESSARGLAINGGISAIIVIEASAGFKAEGNWIGIKLDGSTGGGTQGGILIGPDSNGATIGGTTPAQRNLIANYPTGLEIQGADNTAVQGNWFGVAPNGTAAGTAAGVDISVTDVGPITATGTVIGGTIEGAALTTKACDGACNVIAGAGTGIDLQSPTAATGPTTIRGNYIGLGPSGTTAIANSNRGVSVNHAGKVTIGGTEGEKTANFFAGGSEAIFHDKGASFEAVGNRFGFGPVDNAPVSVPSTGIRTEGAAGTTAKLLGNLIRIAGTGIDSGGPGAEIVGNSIVEGNTAIRLRGATGGAGNLVEGNAVKGPNFNAFQIENGPNRVFGNSIEEVGLSAIFLSGAGATGNLIGGDTALSENVIHAGTYSPIAVVAPGATRNEFARNRGALNGGPFISLGPEGANGGIAPPAIGGALQSSATGTAVPGARVRLFESDKEGNPKGFLGEVVADSAGSWKASFAAVPVGTALFATQTREAGTSELSATATAAADPPPPSCATVPSLCPPSNGGGSAAGNPPVSPVIPPADTTKPKVTVTSGPKARSTATTAKFKFVSNEAGSSFKCKLDKKAFANCGSPKTYKKLAPGKHVFKLSATDPAGNVSTVLTRRFTVLE